MPQTQQATVTSRRVLQWERFTHSVRVPPNYEFEVAYDYLNAHLNMVVIDLKARILEEKILQDTIEIPFTYRVPASTWQMFKRTHKDSWWLSWLVDRKPVVFNTTKDYVKYVFTRKHKYPEAQYTYNEKLGRAVVVEQFRRFYEQIE